MKLRALTRYYDWLHGQWPAGLVEKLPEVQPDGSTNIPGIFVVGDLTGIPLLKFSSDTGARVIGTLASESGFQPGAGGEGVVDVAIIGAGVSGIAAAMEAGQRGLTYQIFESQQPFATIANFPKRKPIYTYPTDMVPAGGLQFATEVKEDLLEEMERYRTAAGIEPIPARIEKIERDGRGFRLIAGGDGGTFRAQRVVVAIGRSGNFRQLGVPGEDKDKVSNRLYDPKDFADRGVLVVGGGDSALEAATALDSAGARVTLSYRGRDFSRPKPENVERLKASEVSIELGTKVKEIRDADVVLTREDGSQRVIPNDAVFALLGREAPLEFFRRSDLRIRGEFTPLNWAALAAFLIFCFWLYSWKAPYNVPFGLTLPDWLNPQPAAFFATLQGWWDTPGTLGHTLKISMASPSFYYTLAYASCVTIFGVRRIRRRRTPYITTQTLTLMSIQVIPLFLLPEIFLPWAGHNAWFDGGLGKWFADTFFPAVPYGHGREYWRAYGFVLAWPLMVWNWFTAEPLWGWLILGSLQTFVAIPLMIWIWGKGAYCGWICSCGALAETLGDQHRQKMPHGPFWTRLNMIGQVFLAFAVVLMILRILGWAGHGWAAGLFEQGFSKFPILAYAWSVDTLWAGILGVGLYFHFSGRVWCRFACPLAALMHVYARFTRFRIFAEKSKCISCNVCTSVCHQGIDVMNFANKGAPMEDPECVRCSACVQSCPTGVLAFGRYDGEGKILLDSLPASPVRIAEGKK